MQKTIGGDRLGSGKRMKVELRNYERSTHDLGYIWRSTMSAGTLVPFLSEPALPGDTFDIDLNCDIKTHPTIGPLFGSYKVQLDVFACPIRLYQGMLHNNKLGIGMEMANVKLPQLELIATVFDTEDAPDIDNAQINPSCILSYLGIRGVGRNIPAYAAVERRMNAIPLLAYWDIYKNYYANKQEEIGAVIHTPQVAIVSTVASIETHEHLVAGAVLIPPQGTVGATGTLALTGDIHVNFVGANPILNQIMLNLTDGRRVSVEELRLGTVTIPVAGTFKVPYNFAKFGTIQVSSWQMIQPWEIMQNPPQISTFPLSNIDDMREDILAAAASTTPFLVTAAGSGSPYALVLGSAGGMQNMLANQEGLALKTYQSDLFNNWLLTEWISGPTGISAITAIDVSAGLLHIDTLVIQRKVYDMLNQIAISGGTYDDWLDAVYNHERFTRQETPAYLGGLIKELVFQEVVSNSASDSSQESPQPLGTLAGKGIMSNKHKGGKVIAKIDEPSYIIGIISLTPRIDYSQGNKWDTKLQTMDDFHKPAMDQIGFQDLLTDQMAWWTTGIPIGSATGDYLTPSAGKQPAWMNYMTNVNQVRGNFAIKNNEMFMTLNRRYETTGTGTVSNIEDLTTYIDPSKFNHIFAQTSLDSQNFWAQISVDITARRKMSAKIMPNL